MKHVVVHRPGGLDRLRLEEAEDPRPAAGEVRVRTSAVGVNYADCIVRRGLYASAKEYVGWPITPGFEFAGVVDALGEGVEGPAVGAEVFGVTRFGGYATHVIVPRTQLFDRPATLTADEAAALPTVAMTAWYALFRLGAVTANQTILVHSAAGGVGGTLVRMGRIAGARVLAVVGAPHKVDAARDAGADVVIDASSGSPWPAVREAAPDGVDLIFDSSGGATLRAGYRALAPEGRLVAFGHASLLPRGSGRTSWLRLAWGWFRMPRFDPLDLTQCTKSVMGFNLSFLFHRAELLREAMEDVLAWHADGRLPSPPITAFALAEVAAAHAALESGETVGKLVLRP